MERQRRLHRAALHHGGGDEPAEHAGRRVLGMAVVGGGDGKGVVGTGRGGGGGGEGGRGAQTPGHRDLRPHGDREAVVAEHLGCHAGGEVGCVVEEPAPLALAVHPQGRGRLDLDADVAVERHGQGVESRAQVRRRGRGPGAHAVRLPAVRRGAGTATGEARPAAAAPGRRRAGARASPRPCRRWHPAGAWSVRWCTGRNTRVAWTPGHVSTETDAAARASTVRPASLTCATSCPSRSTGVLPISGATRVHQRQPVQAGLGQHRDPRLPGHGGQQEHGTPVHGPHDAQHVTAPGCGGVAGLHADDALEADERRVAWRSSPPPGA